jgi:hypothetical protein
LNIYEAVKDIPNGVYLVRGDTVTNYGDRCTVGYAVPLRELHVKDMRPSTLFIASGKDYYFANHIDTQIEARQIARAKGTPVVYSFREQNWIKA